MDLLLREVRSNLVFERPPETRLRKATAGGMDMGTVNLPAGNGRR